MGLAQTGTGKTAAFALPILQGLLGSPGCGLRALVLAPTRELARQIDQELRSLARFTRVSTATVFGGVAPRLQVRSLRRGPDVVVGCPGRVLDLLGQGVLDVTGVETLVLDEADHMLDMGFLPDLRKIVARLPRRRQNLLFSATMPREIRSLADRILSHPVVVELAPSRPNEAVDHYLHPVREDQKRSLLDRVLSAEDCQTAIVFTRTKHRARRTAEQLTRQGRRAVALQGNMSQSQRDRAMAGFRERRFDVLVATDIAARGLDIAGVDYVVNFDVPNTTDAYTHRIGRTGRSGASGKACTFVTPSDAAWLRATERVLGAPIPRRASPGDGGPERTTPHPVRLAAARPGAPEKGAPRPARRRRRSSRSSGRPGGRRGAAQPSRRP